MLPVSLPRCCTDRQHAGDCAQGPASCATHTVRTRSSNGTDSETLQSAGDEAEAAAGPAPADQPPIMRCYQVRRDLAPPASASPPAAQCLRASCSPSRARALNSARRPQCQAERPHEADGALQCGQCGSDFVELVSAAQARAEALEAGTRDRRCGPCHAVTLCALHSHRTRRGAASHGASRVGAAPRGLTLRTSAHVLGRRACWLRSTPALPADPASLSGAAPRGMRMCWSRPAPRRVRLVRKEGRDVSS